MAYCGPRGLPHLHFLGGPAQWTQHDREAALWWLMHERQRCSSCGTRQEEWDPKQGGQLQAYEPKIDRCAGCAALERGQKDLEHEQKERRAPSGARVILRKREVVVDAQSAR
jgi:hypothetical protein